MILSVTLTVFSVALFSIRHFDCSIRRFNCSFRHFEVLSVALIVLSVTPFSIRHFAYPEVSIHHFNRAINH
ncbi:hypothetical protein [Lysinibacillus sp. fls2-241-R2A-57]|nr:hypothetical protein [Lysinibacillus sp. fls2-241-R2A-57]